MVKLGSAIKNQVAMGQNENDIMKRNDEYALNAFITKDKKKNMRQAPTKIKYAKNSLLDKIISSSLNENAINKRLEEISYAAINGQRQTEGTYKPEGVQMLGQLGREKPLEAITKEMIKEYQEEEQKPFMVDGEARTYAKADYEPILQLPESLDDVKDDMKTIYKNKVATAKTIKDAEEYLKTADEYYRGLLRDINVFGMTDAKRKEKEQTERHIRQERMKYDALRNQMDVYDFEIKRLFDEGKEIKRLNALIPEKNREEIAKYEQSLLQHNRSRLNIQQQPNESDMEYYQRLREVERTKMDPTLYKQYSINKVSKELKPKLGNLFKDEGQIEEVIKSLSENDKFIVNKNFDRVEKDFIDKYGYNPSMNTKMAINAILEPFASSSSIIKDLIKRKNAQDLYIPDLKDEHQLQAVKTLQGVFNRKNIEPKYVKVLDKYRDIKERKEAKRQADASTDIQRVFRGYTGRTIASREGVEQASQRVYAQYAAEQAAAEQAAAEQAAATKLQQALRNKKAINTFAKLHVQKAIDAQKRREDVASTRDIQQQRMDELASQKKALSKISSAFARTLTQPEINKLLEKQKASNRIKAYMKAKEPRDIYSYALENTIRPITKLQAYARKNQPEPKNIQTRIKDIVNEKQRIEELNAESRRVAAEEERLRQERLRQEAASINIQSVFRGHKGRKQYEQDKINRLVQLSTEAQQRGQMEEPISLSLSPVVSPTALTALSGATTIAEQERAGLRKPRSDLGGERGPSKKALKKEQQRQLDSAFYETLTPDELNYFNSKKRIGGKKVTTILNEIRKQREGPQGSGFRKPPKRQVKVNPEEKKKNRLQLVIAQIKAGNTNPKLILEVNKLYKSLYDIDNAFMMLK